MLIDSHRFGIVVPEPGLDGGTLIRESIIIGNVGELTDGGTLIRESVVIGDTGALTDGGTLIREEVVAP